MNIEEPLVSETRIEAWAKSGLSSVTAAWIAAGPEHDKHVALKP
ncbi:MAG: hypothetical protein ACJASS_001725 [Sulfitobacter sp.]|jgi:hypothetical protein